MDSIEVDVFKYKGAGRQFINFLNHDQFSLIFDCYKYITKDKKHPVKIDLNGLYYSLKDISFAPNILNYAVSKYSIMSHCFAGGRLTESVKLDDYGSITTVYGANLYSYKSIDRKTIGFRDKKGVLHNERGPAYIQISKTHKVEDYYLNGINLEKQDWENQITTKLYW